MFAVCPPGYLVGYISHRKSHVEAASCSSGGNQPAPAPVTQAPAGPAELEMDFKSIAQLLAKKMTKEAFENTLRYIDHVHTRKTDTDLI